MNYYIWEYATSQKTVFFNCGLETFEGSTRVPWTHGERWDTRKFPRVLQYRAANNLPPEDYVLTSGPQFLVSQRIVDIFNLLYIEGIYYYESEIIKPSKEMLKGFYTLNITNVLDCVDTENSEFSYEEFGPVKIVRFEKLRLNNELIPNDVKIFRLSNERTLVIVNVQVKESFEDNSISGVKLVPIEDFVDFI